MQDSGAGGENDRKLLTKQHKLVVIIVTAAATTTIMITIAIISVIISIYKAQNLVRRNYFKRVHTRTEREREIAGPWFWEERCLEV